MTEAAASETAPPAKAPPPKPIGRSTVPKSPTPLRANSSQRIAILVVDATLVGLSFWVLGGFFSALAWALVLTIATWPLYERFVA